MIQHSDNIVTGDYIIDTWSNEFTEFTPDDWEKCTTRLRNGVVSSQQLLADCNPEGPDHWLKKRCDEGKTVMLGATFYPHPDRMSDPDPWVY